MKDNQLLLLVLLLCTGLISCKKDGGSSAQPCETNKSAKLTFTNTGATPLTVVLGYGGLNPQGQPLNIGLNLDVPAGSSVDREVLSGSGIGVVWYKNCPNACSIVSSETKTYQQCNMYSESKAE